MNLTDLIQTWSEIKEIFQTQRRQQPFAFAIFIALCLNLAIAPIVYASTGESITRQSAYAIGALLLVIVGLSIYLFAVILQPEKF